MIRVLQCVNDMQRAGLETMLMNYYRGIDRDQVQFDFLTHRPYKGDYDDEIERMGGRVYHAPRLYPWNYPAYFIRMAKFFREHPEYRIVHSHIDAMSYLPLLAAKRAGIPVRIAHSHNTAIDRDFKYILKQLFRSRLNSVCNYRFACGDEAGKFLFGGRDFRVIANAIEADSFRFSEDVRQKKRAELGIGDELVIGHVGRFSSQKNHGLLIEIFSELLKKEPNALLLLIGTGERENEIKEQAESLGIAEKVRFLGKRSDVNELYQAMDVFVMPSLFEGVPVVGIEAQYADLPCCFSDRVPREVCFNEKSVFIPLSCSTAEWAGRILKCRGAVRKPVRNPYYDINETVSMLADIYLHMDTELENQNSVKTG